VQVNGRGADNPTSLPLSVTAPSFLAGQTYGIYLELQGVTASNTLLYSNGPSTSYTNLDLELVTNCAKAAGGIGATTFSPREFNGTSSVVKPAPWSSAMARPTRWPWSATRWSALARRPRRTAAWI
jgi:hypothetical protein